MWSSALIVALLAIGAASMEAQGARVTGVVLDSTRAPISGATVSVDGHRDEARSDSTGRFALAGVAVGARRLRVRRVGAAPVERAIVVVEGRAAEVEIVLDALAQRLPAVEVSAASVRLVGVMGGSDFAGRQRMGGGTFFSRARIDSLRPRRVHDLFRMTSGLAVHSLPDNQVKLVTKRGMMGVVSKCEVALFLDGVRVPHDVLAELQVDHVEAIEAYGGPASTPVAFGGTGSVCGAAAIWSRR